MDVNDKKLGSSKTNKIDIREELKTQSDIEIDLRQLFFIMWDAKIFIFITIFGFASLSVAYVLWLPNTYRSDAMLAPVSSGDNGGIVAKFGGLASLAGVDIGASAGGDKAALAIEVIKSREFISRLVKKYNILPEMIASKKWNSKSDELVFDEKKYDSLNKTWKWKNTENRSPSIEDLHEKYIKSLNIDEDNDTGFIELSFIHHSPTFAKEMVQRIVSEINYNLRQEEVLEAEESIAYLNEQISKTSNNELKTGLYTLIQSQTEKIMLAKASPDYVFKVLDPAIIPDEKYGPRRAVICIGGTLLGALFAFLLVLARYFVKKSSREIS